ncbi:hypothetical protein AJ80_03843 [Polytolypa hystricis UAMH7299]|uniref:Mmc1 C-terminal domain-containing protein n=1 Tax=Polytolypa hystricis (strain UAMH7299) TaxID=1447883 RepID=A0A2B7YFK1_POLH7|nr:hypothetical protein AJ80_03843 [Polytolypa hystricis UAMH7299]
MRPKLSAGRLPRPRTAAAAALLRLTSDTPFFSSSSSSSSFYFCPSCSTWRRDGPGSSLARSTTTTTTRRGYATATSTTTPAAAGSAADPIRPAAVPRGSLVSASAVNVNRDIPARYKELYEALRGVREDAGAHVEISRLQLAIRGLEGERPVVRVAVLGLNDAATTVRLVRLLLADPLVPKDEWEEYLEKYQMDTSRGLLIKYGEKTDLAVRNTLLPTIAIRSMTLKSANLEILISSLGVSSSSSSSSDVSSVTSGSLLVPTISIQSTTSGAHTVVRYPVHKTLVCGKGAQGLLSYTKLIARAGTEGTAEDSSIQAAFQLSSSGDITAEEGDRQQGVSFVNIRRAEEALDKFRESVANSTEYERGWTGSGVQPLVDWISGPRKGQEEADTAMMKSFVGSILDDAMGSVAKEQQRKVTELKAKSVSEDVRQSLDSTVATWAERGHTELRDSLAQGFANQSWRTLSWWKLFWRVDDVGMITSNILENNWLPEAEKEVIWIGGKTCQAGVFGEGVDLPKINSEKSQSPPVEKGEAGEREENNSASSNSGVAGILWPAQIEKKRKQLALSTVPALQALAQGLVLFSVSTTTLTSALSALVYASTSTTTVYEAGTVAAVGLIYSLRRQQKKWDAARQFWELEVNEEGRKALQETEDMLRALIREEGRLSPNAVEVAEAQKRIEEARQALETVK